MTDAIRPALTPEQWESALRGELLEAYGDDEAYRLPPALRSMRSEAGDDVGFDDPAHASVALGNAALPDGHPGKITREDVREVAALADMLDSDAGWRVAAKLAALLPPDGAP